MSDITYKSNTACALNEIFLSPGVYLLRVWGAEGGSWTSTGNKGGKGGYAQGHISLRTTTRIFINIGGNGQNKEGGCNGGGKTNGQNNSGGGATDIRIGENSLYSRVIVAGGGGGSGDGNTGVENGGCGGGLTGGNGIQREPKYPGTGGTQDGPGLTCVDGAVIDSDGVCQPGSFGSGGTQKDKYTGGGGGGGWYGGASGWNNDAAGGGSGFVFTENSKVPNGFLLKKEYYLKGVALLDGDSVMPDFDAPLTKTTVGHEGNGAALITLISSVSKYDQCRSFKSFFVNAFISLMLS